MTGLIWGCWSLHNGSIKDNGKEHGNYSRRDAEQITLVTLSGARFSPSNLEIMQVSYPTRLNPKTSEELQGASCLDAGSKRTTFSN